MRVARLDRLGEAAARDVVREARERLHDDEAVDAVGRVVEDFARNQPAFARVVCRVDDVAHELDQFVAVCVVLVELVALRVLLDGLYRMGVNLCGDASDEEVLDGLFDESALDLFAADDFIDPEEVRHARQVNFHAVVHQVVFDVAVCARVVVHQDFAEERDARLAVCRIDVYPVERVDGAVKDLERLFRVGEALLRDDGDFFHDAGEPFVIDLLRVARVTLVGTASAVNGFDSVHHGEAPEHVQAEVHRELESRVHVLCVGAGRDDGNVRKSRFVESLSREDRILDRAAVFAVLRERDGNLVVWAFGVVFEPQEVFADVHLGGEADVVVDILLAERERFRTSHREQLDLVAEMLEVGRGEDAESAGEVRDKDCAGFFVLFLELDGEERPFRLGRKFDLSPCADGFDKALDADADRAAGVAFVELQHQKFLHGNFVQHPVHFVGENRIVSAAEAHDLHEFERGILCREHRRSEHPHMERVLDFHPGMPIDVLVEDSGERFRREDGNSHPRKVLRDVVVDEHVRMVGTTGEAYREVALLSDFVENLSALFGECRAECRKRLFALGHRLVENLP